MFPLGVEFLEGSEKRDHVGVGSNGYAQAISRAWPREVAHEDVARAESLEDLDGGAVPVVERVSDRGARNSGKNPLLVLWMELNRDALAYWRELGLTPSGLKRLNESAMAGAKEQSALEKALASMT